MPNAVDRCLCSCAVWTSALWGRGSSREQNSPFYSCVVLLCWWSSRPYLKASKGGKRKFTYIPNQKIEFFEKIFHQSDEMSIASFRFQLYSISLFLSFHVTQVNSEIAYQSKNKAKKLRYCRKIDALSKSAGLCCAISRSWVTRQNLPLEITEFSM